MPQKFVVKQPSNETYLTYYDPSGTTNPPEFGTLAEAINYSSQGEVDAIALAINAGTVGMPKP